MGKTDLLTFPKSGGEKKAVPCASLSLTTITTTGRDKTNQFLSNSVILISGCLLLGKTKKKVTFPIFTSRNVASGLNSWIFFFFFLMDPTLQRPYSL